jgi:hypothetical protein
LERGKNHNSAETRQGLKISPKFTSHQPLVHDGQIIREADFKNNPKHTKKRNLLNAGQFVFRAVHSTTLQYMRLADRITLNFNSNMSMAVVFLDIEEGLNKTLHSGLIYKLSELEFSTSLIKLIASFLADRKFKVLVESEFPTQRKIEAGVPQGSVLAPVLYSL